MRTVRTMCPMNCHPTLCGMLVDVEDGKVAAVHGDPDNPDSRGFLCIRGHAAREIIGNPQRLLHPLRRSPRSGAWQRTTWEDALDAIAERQRAAAKRRGAYVVTIDVRRTEAAAQSHETILLRPGTDAALALGMMHVIVSERLHDAAFVARHTVGFDALAAHLARHDLAWASAATGLDAEQIAALARRYAATNPAMILPGGTSMHKGAEGWQGARAVACLPALTGNLGVPGAGLGPRHGASSHGQGLASIAARDRRPPGDEVPSQMSRITEALEDGRVRVLLLFGTDMVSSFADAGRVAAALERLDLIATYDLFLHDTARRHADLVLPATSWLESTGCKSTNTHLYLMPKVLEPPGEARPAVWVLRALGRRPDVAAFFPWAEA